MNLYEVKDVDTGQVLIQASTAGEVARLLKCSSATIGQAYHGDYAIKHKYRVEQVDIALKKNDPIWIDWDLCRNKILKYGRK